MPLKHRATYLAVAARCYQAIANSKLNERPNLEHISSGSSVFAYVSSAWLVVDLSHESVEEPTASDGTGESRKRAIARSRKSPAKKWFRRGVQTVRAVTQGFMSYEKTHSRRRHPAD